jgi:hypothetical protein
MIHFRFHRFERWSAGSERVEEWPVIDRILISQFLQAVILCQRCELPVDKLLNIGGHRYGQQRRAPLAVGSAEDVLESVMRNKMQVYGPDELKVLSQIVNAVLSESRTESVALDAQLRERLGKQVIKHAASDVLNVDGIKRAVLAGLKN